MTEHFRQSRPLSYMPCPRCGKLVAQCGEGKTARPIRHKCEPSAITTTTNGSNRDAAKLRAMQAGESLEQYDREKTEEEQARLKRFMAQHRQKPPQEPEVFSSWME